MDGDESQREGWKPGKGGDRTKGAGRMEISAPIPSSATSATAMAGPSYSLPPSHFASEDIMFCVDVDVESKLEMKSSTRATRLDAIKQAILLFVNAKLSIFPDHRFCFSLLGQSCSWLRRDLTNDVNLASKAVRSLTTTNRQCGVPDLSMMFRLATQQALKSRNQGRLFRVILIYCRSSTKVMHGWPVGEKLFTMDALYLHDKPGPDNCPQKVYDSLVDTVDHVSEHEGYIFENGQGVRVLFRQMCLLLCHPLQRCLQDDLDLPRSIVKKAPAPSESGNGEDVTSNHAQ